MWHARQILSLGCRWRIGSGDNIRVMHDPWLCGSASRWVPSPQPTCVYQLSVRDLLHDNYKAWDIAKVRNLFSGDVAERILETPLVSSVRKDKVIWDEEKNGCYSVKSGYKLAMRYILCSDKYHRMSPDSLSIVGKASGVYSQLSSGDEEIEDELHIFFKCAVARESCESSDTASRVVMLLWCIWHNRNDKLWNDNVQMPRQIGRYAFDAWTDWYSVHKPKSNSVNGSTETDLVRWEKPALVHGWYDTMAASCDFICRGRSMSFTFSNGRS
ncbi:hypothetical protein TSUD_20690 [Trifolium subterraneum]|uniref:Reverse transcriptase zinc-binding domain-containing protein n=1 Tax=Trifolium subterraneum TaxID=3900 RepID=A0A2Z6NCI8_TRISU|nr:hypothetical protein TSUD_20690 [Trifolium subterraneum]